MAAFRAAWRVRRRVPVSPFVVKRHAVIRSERKKPVCRLQALKPERQQEASLRSRSGMTR